MVVYRFVLRLNQISWLPAAWRSNSKPHAFSLRTISLYRNPARRPIYSGNHDGIVSPLASGWQVRNAVAFAPGFNELPGDVACDVECFGDCPPLRDEAG